MSDSESKTPSPKQRQRRLPRPSFDFKPTRRRPRPSFDFSATQEYSQAQVRELAHGGVRALAARVQSGSAAETLVLDGVPAMPTLPPAQHAALEDLMVAREWRPSPPRRPRSLAVGTEAPPDEVSDDIPTMALSRRELPRTARHRPSHVAPPHQPTYQQATTQPAAARHRSSTAITLRGHSPARPRRIDARRYNARALQVPAAYRLETEPVRRVSQAPTDAIRTRLSLCFVFFALLAGGAGAMGTIVLRQNLLLAPWASLVALALLPCIALAATALLAINFKLLRIPSALAMPSCAAFSALAFVTAALLSAWAAGLEVALGDLALSRHVFREAGALLTARLSELTGLSALHLSVWWLAQLGCVVFLALVLTRRCMRGRGI